MSERARHCSWRQRERDVQDDQTLVVDPADWPYGLRCFDCNRKLEGGDLYSERLSGFVDETPAVEIICIDCAVPGRDS